MYYLVRGKLILFFVSLLFGRYHTTCERGWWGEVALICFFYSYLGHMPRPAAFFKNFLYLPPSENPFILLF